jgi:ABC-type nitrate/sulfonate/bicarbonate transport system substrate-binding protein
LATSDDMIKNHADTVMRFVRATRKGMLYARDNRDGAIDVFVKSMKGQPDAAARGYDELRKVMAEDGAIAPEAQGNELALRADMLSMQVSQIPPIAAVFDFSWLEKVNAELKATGWKAGP